MSERLTLIRFLLAKQRQFVSDTKKEINKKGGLFIPPYNPSAISWQSWGRAFVDPLNKNLLLNHH